MKKTAIVILLLTFSLFAAGCQYLNIPSFRLYIGYDLNPSAKIIPDDALNQKAQNTK